MFTAFDDRERRRSRRAVNPAEEQTRHQRDATDGAGRRGRLVSFLMWAGPLVLVALILLPARADAIRGDDEWTFDFRGTLALQHVTLWHEIWESMRQTVQFGRTEIVATVLADPVLYVFNRHPTGYHLYLVAVTVACGAVLWAVVRRLTGLRSLAAVVVVAFGAFLQFRFYHDALLGYEGAAQWAVGLLLASVLTFLKAMEGGSRRWAWSLLTALLFGLAAATEQWIPTLIVIPVWLALLDSRPRRALALTVPTVAMGLALILLGYLGNSGALTGQTVGGGYNAALNIGHVLHSLVKSWVPPLPTSNRVFTQLPSSGFYGYSRPYPLGGSLTPAEWLGAAWRGVAVLLVVFAFSLRLRRPGLLAVAPPRAALRMLAIGVPLWFVSPLLVVVAQKYQVEGSLTRGYLETVAQVAGVALVLGAVAIWLRPLASRASRRTVIAFGAVASVALGFAAAVDGFNNMRIVGLEQDVRHTRDLLESSAHHGLLDAVPDRSTLFFSSVDLLWPTGAWGIVPGAAGITLYSDSGRNDDVRPDADQAPLTCAAGTAYPPPQCAPPRAVSAWVRVRAFKTGGTVILARMADATRSNYLSAPVTQLTVYTEQSGSRTPPPPALAAPRVNGSLWTSAGLSFHKLSSGSGWAIYRAQVPARGAPPAQSFTDPRSPVNFDRDTPPDTLVREFGTKQLLP